MLTKFSIVTLFFLFMIVPTISYCQKIGSGEVIGRSSDVTWKLFGNLKIYPTNGANIDFNGNDTGMAWILDESGTMDHNSIRAEARLGFDVTGANFNFMSILEGDFVLNANNTDRGSGQPMGEANNGMSGEDFGIEKLEAGYDFSYLNLPVRLSAGWNDKFLDRTSGILYGDDHPFIGLNGTVKNVDYMFLYITILDDISLEDGEQPIWDADDLDWRVYALKLTFNLPFLDAKFSPFYAFSDNNNKNANVHYIGFETYGKYNIFIPRAEFVYATGDKDDLNGMNNVNISAFAGFLSLEAKIKEYFIPYIGSYFLSGDGDADDGKIHAFNAITNNARYSDVFGMENAMIHRWSPVLGSTLYSNSPEMLGGQGSGYGGLSGTSSANSPGMITVGIGAKGTINKFNYKTQLQYLRFASTGALEDYYHRKDVSNEMGIMWDTSLTYHFTNHFSIGDTFSVFTPGDGYQDIWGNDYDKTAFLNTVEFVWSF